MYFVVHVVLHINVVTNLGVFVYRHIIALLKPALKILDLILQSLQIVFHLANSVYLLRRRKLWRLFLAHLFSFRSNFFKWPLS